MARSYREPREPQVSSSASVVGRMGYWVKVGYKHYYYFDPSLFERACSVNTQEKKKEDEEDDDDDESSDVATSEDEEHDEVEDAGDEPEDEDDK